MTDCDDPEDSDTLPEVPAICSECDEEWLITDIPPAKPSVTALIGLTGWKCSDCVGDDPQLRMFKARKSFSMRELGDD